jgi:hypothetical protein
MRVAIHQPNYLPWCGYFSKMRRCDVFIFLDDAEISPGQSYVYRSRVRNAQGPLWLSIPTHRQPEERILSVRFANPRWVYKHVHSLQSLYGKCPYFDEVFALLEPLYSDPGETLATFNMRAILRLSAYLGLPCQFYLSSEFCLEERRDDRLIALARRVGADTYVSGQGGQHYQDPAKFAAAGIQLEIHAYAPIPYCQNYQDFVPGLSIVDALFHLGRGALSVLPDHAETLSADDKSWES